MCNEYDKVRGDDIPREKDEEKFPPLENSKSEYITMLILGILLILVGIMNVKGDISSIHLYCDFLIGRKLRRFKGV